MESTYVKNHEENELDQSADADTVEGPFEFMH